MCVGGDNYYIFRMHVKGVIEFFVMQGGQDILFSC